MHNNLYSCRYVLYGKQWIFLLAQKDNNSRTELASKVPLQYQYYKSFLLDFLHTDKTNSLVLTNVLDITHHLGFMYHTMFQRPSCLQMKGEGSYSHMPVENSVCITGPNKSRIPYPHFHLNIGTDFISWYKQT